MTTSREDFQRDLKQARHIAVLTGAGVSAESNIPTFRGAGGLWRRYSAQELANPSAWSRSPGLVWEFYDYRRQIMCDKEPNPGHYALARLEEKCREGGKKFHLVTQNIDDLHFDAGSENVTRLHGSLWMVRCLQCQMVAANRDVPITPAYEGAGAPDVEGDPDKFTEGDLPRCAGSGCSGIVRPHVVWFGESLNHDDISRAFEEAAACDLFIVVGTSSMVAPANVLAPKARMNGAKVAEINLEATPDTEYCDYAFQGKSGEILPTLLDVDFS